MTGNLIVTGGGRGIGAATALMAADRGYDVCVNYVTRSDRANEIVEKIKAKGRNAIAVQADVSKEADVSRMFETVDKELGTLNGLVNSAGITAGISRLDDERVTEELLANLWAINISGTILPCRYAILRMSTNHGGSGGSIVNVGSIASKIGAGGVYVDYTASKGAIDAFTIGLAKEVAGEGIRVNCIRPGITDTEIQPPGRVEQAGPDLPPGRAAEAHEMASVILHLISDEASYVSGAIVDAAGGM
ncbi:MAG: NAD(P)-dependent oxidoreductase [Alphaproteobacteria bacterium]|nr:NAD(P)-dependent oxidoreductase [Alphaproteobacteria bacterium]|tara:strand:- start:1123 stop:1863 length:741 start_codon:yes stop_codon:yes gene_type:complete